MAQHLARSSTGELLVLIDEHAVHIDGVDSLGDAVGVAVSGGVLKLVVVEDDEVGVIAFLDEALVFDAEASALFTEGTYFYDIVSEGTRRVTIARNNRIKVR